MRLLVNLVVSVTVWSVGLIYLTDHGYYPLAMLLCACIGICLGCGCGASWVRYREVDPLRFAVDYYRSVARSLDPRVQPVDAVRATDGYYPSDN